MATDSAAIVRTKIRLTTSDMLDAFQEGVSYRLYYLPGPVPTILSGEVIGSEAEAEESLEPEGSLAEDEILQRHRLARPIVVMLAVLALGIPLAGFAASRLPESLRCAVMAGLFVISIGFVYWVLRRMNVR